MYLPGQQCQIPVTPKKKTGLSGCGCGGSCGCGSHAAGLGVYMSVCDPVATSALMSTNRGVSGLGVYMPVNHPVPTSSLVDTNQGLGYASDMPALGYPKMYAKGLGLFESTDFSTWGIGEYAIIGIGIYVLASLFGDIGRGRKKVRKFQGKRRKKRAAQLSAEQSLL